SIVIPLPGQNNVPWATKSAAVRPLLGLRDACMYLRTERPFTDAERRCLTERLRRCGWRVQDDATDVVILSLLEGVGIFAVVMIVSGHDRSGPVGSALGIAVGLVVSFFVVVKVLGLVDSLRERRRLRDARDEAVAVVERIEATAAAILEGGF